MASRKDGFGYRWHTVDPRWDVSANPNEPNLFGWVVEVDPFNPGSMPVKRTALGRFKHESAQYVVDKDNRLAFYLGDDERNEYIYKFVCAGKYNPTNRAANRNLLDSGVLYVARFDSNLSGQWIALLPGTLGVDGVALRANPNFAGADDAEVLAKILIKTRMAADAVGATMMDRPEWTGARPRIGGFDQIEVYCTLTNNNRRGGTTRQQPRRLHRRRLGPPAGGCGQPARQQPVRPHHPLARDRQVGGRHHLRLGPVRAERRHRHHQDAAAHQRLQGQHRRRPERQRRLRRARTACGSTTSAACGCRPTRPAMRWATGSTSAPTPWSAPTRTPA